MREFPEEGKFYGFPDAQKRAVKEVVELLSFSIRRDRPYVGMFVGPQKVGKTSAMKQVEKELRNSLGIVASYETTSETYPKLVYLRADRFLTDLGNYPIQFWSEVNIQDLETLQRIIAEAEGKGKKVLVDVVNKDYPIGDPRNNLEAYKVLRSLAEKPDIHQLYAKPEGVVIPREVSDLGGENTVDLSNPTYQRALMDHEKRLQIAIRNGFIPGITFVRDFGTELVTKLVYADDPDKAYGSTVDQYVYTTLPRK